jgi:hypothetical protein
VYEQLKTSYTCFEKPDEKEKTKPKGQTYIKTTGQNILHENDHMYTYNIKIWTTVHVLR